MSELNTFGWASSDANALVAPNLEYMRKNRWILDFAGLPARLTNVFGTAGATLRLNCKTANRPKISFEDTKVERINGSVYMAGKPEYEPLNVVMYDALRLRTIDPAGGDDTTFAVSDIMEAWRELIYQPNRGDAFGSAANYKGFAYLHMLEPVALDPTADDQDPDFSGGDDAGASITQTWLYTGLWPKEIDPGELSYSDSEVAEVSVSFRYDRAFRVKRSQAIIA